MAITITKDSASIFTTNNVNVLDTCKVDDTKFAIIYSEATGNTTNVIIATISGTAITFGTPVQVYSGKSNMVAIDLIATNKIAMAWTRTNNDYNDACVATISGTVPTLGSVNNYDTAGNGLSALVSYNTDSFLCFYGSSSAVACLTVSTTTITDNGNTSLRSPGSGCFSASKIDTNKVLVVYSGSSFASAYLSVITVTGTTPSGAETQFNLTTDCYFDRKSICCISTTKAIIAYGRNTASKTFVVEVDISGNTLTINDANKYQYATTRQFLQGIDKISNTFFLHSIGSELKIESLESPSTSPTLVDAAFNYETGGTNRVSMNYLGGGYFVISFQDAGDSNKGKSIIGTVTVATNWTKSLSETLNLSDSIIKGVGKKQTDNPSIVDSIKKSPEKKRTDNLTLSDLLSETDQVKISETLNLSDITKRTIGKLITDSSSLSDSIKKNNGKYLTEILALSDILKFTSQLSLFEALSIIDGGIKLTINKDLSENLTIVDNIGLLLVYSRLISENLPLSDAISTISAYSHTINESIALADNLEATMVLSEYLAEAINFSDEIKFNIEKYTSDNLTISDAVSSLATYYKTLNDKIDLSDFIKTTIEKKMLDNIVLNDNITFSIEKILIDISLLSDLLSATIEKSVNDGININDILDLQTGKEVNLLDNLIVSEVLFKDTGKVISNDITISDFINIAVDYKLKIQDSVDVIEHLVKQYDLSLREAIIIIDNLQKITGRPLGNKSVLPRNKEKTVLINSKKDRIILISNLK